MKALLVFALLSLLAACSTMSSFTPAQVAAMSANLTPPEQAAMKGNYVFVGESMNAVLLTPAFDPVHLVSNQTVQNGDGSVTHIEDYENDDIGTFGTTIYCTTIYWSAQTARVILVRNSNMTVTEPPDGPVC